MRATPGHRLLVLLLVVGGAAAVVIASSRPRPDSGRTREVFVVGDSLTVDAREALPDAMAERGVVLAGFDARNGRTTPEGLDVLRSVADDLPGAVLVALGTNDVFTATATAVEEWVATARSIVGDRRLIWVNLHVDPSRSGIEELERWQHVNAWLATAARRHDVELADWSVWSSINGVDLGPDGVHYGPRASARRAAFYADVVAGQVQTIG